MRASVAPQVEANFSSPLEGLLTGASRVRVRAVHEPKVYYEASSRDDIASLGRALATIGTDPQRVGLMQDEHKLRAWNTSFLAYNDESPGHGPFFEDPISSTSVVSRSTTKPLGT